MKIVLLYLVASHIALTVVGFAAAIYALPIPLASEAPTITG
jgi:hypothetical protein